MELHDYNFLTKDQHDIFFKFLESTQDSNDLAKSNMYDIDWQNKPNTLPYILTYTDRFKGESGEFNILFDGDKVVAVGGVYRSNFNEYISIAGARTFVNDNYRRKNLMREYILPRHKKWSIEHNHKIIMVSFNEYNKKLINIFKRNGLADNSLPLLQNSHHLFNDKIYEVEFPCNVQHTKQYIFYEKLDKDFSFDWATLKY
jgi:hypothetical protein